MASAMNEPLEVMPNIGSTNMLVEHFAAVERQLLATSHIVDNSGHNIHKGTPREAFVSEFLRHHLGSRWGIGTGEIIDRNSRAGESRNQIDIVVFRQDHPRLDFGGSISAFLAESVVAVIEVKSTLSRADVLACIEKGKRLKGLDRQFFGRSAQFANTIRLPTILSYMVAYKGPRNFNIIADWIVSCHEEAAVALPNLPPEIERRSLVNSPALDGIFVLGQGFAHFDNTLMTPSTGGSEIRAANPGIKWIMSTASDANLFFLFLLLTQAINNYEHYVTNVIHYMPDGGVRGGGMRFF